MRRARSDLGIVIVMTLVGIGLYAVRWAVFSATDLRNEMWRFLIGDVGFLFLQIAFVTLFIDRLLANREKRAMLEKLNMVIGAFFAETGTELLGVLAAADTRSGELRAHVVPDASWGAPEYAQARDALERHDAEIEIGPQRLKALAALLGREKGFLLGLLGNAALFEHESFTDLLWAITHLAEELEARPSLDDLPPTDRAHLAGDVKRAYTRLVREWLHYLRHLQSAYPYLFSLATRRNPLDPQASVTVQA
jgi:hypothetical protein